MSQLARLGGVFTDPQPAFADIAARPSGAWIPIALLIMTSLVYLSAFSQRVGWDRFMRQQMETNTALQERMEQLSPEQRERAVQMQSRLAGIAGYVGAVVATPVSMLVIAGVLLFMANLMGAGLSFKTTFAITAYSFLVTLVSTAVALAVMFLKNPDDFNLKNPTAFNLGAYLDPQSTSKFLVSVATSLDLYVLWIIMLLATGLSVASRRLSFAKALLAVAVPWAAYVALKSAFAAIWG